MLFIYFIHASKFTLLSR